MVEKSDFQLHYDKIGQGLPVVLLHGLGLNNKIWLPVANLLKHRNRTILPDLRGHGQSSTGLADGNMKQLAEDVLRLFDDLKVEMAILGGHSMGGYVALAFAEMFPERLTGFALIASNTQADPVEKREARLKDANRVMIEGSSVVGDTLVPRLTTDSSLQMEMRAMIANTEPAGMHNILLAIANRPDRSQVFAGLPCPAVIITGKHDQISNLEAAEKTLRLNPGAELFVLEKAGHMPMLEDPEGTAAALLSLLGD